jgi:hypothetical protein
MQRQREPEEEKNERRSRIPSWMYLNFMLKLEIGTTEGKEL